MKTTYLAIVFCLFLSISNSQNKNTEIVEQFIENFNKKDSTATLNTLHKNYIESWYKLPINSSKRDFSKAYSWANVMHEYEEIEIISTSSKEVVVNSIYYSDLDELLGNMPYKCKKKFVISNGKIIKIINTKNKRYDLYQNKRKNTYVKFKNWLRKNHDLIRTDFKMNRKDALKMKKIVLEYLVKDEIVERD